MSNNPVTLDARRNGNLLLEIKCEHVATAVLLDSIETAPEPGREYVASAASACLVALAERVHQLSIALSLDTGQLAIGPEEAS